MMEGPCADCEEKREPAGDIDTVVDGLKVLDPKRPIREADVRRAAAKSALCHVWTYFIPHIAYCCIHITSETNKAVIEVNIVDRRG